MQQEDITQEASPSKATITKPPISEKSQTIQPSKTQALSAFIVLLVINILNYTARSTLPAVQTHVKSEFHLTDIQLGLLNSSFLLIYGLATLPLGVWADKGTRKNIIAICVTIWSVFTALGGFTLNFIQIFTTQAFLGIGEAGYAPASLSLIGDYFPKEMRGRMLSIWSTGNLFGTAIGLALGGLIADKLGWRWAFYIVGIPGLITAFLIWRVVEPRRGASDTTEQDGHEISMAHGNLGKGFSSTVRKLIKIPTYWVLAGAMICSFFIIGASLAWLSTYLIRTFELTSTKAGIISAGALAGGSLDWHIVRRMASRRTPTTFSTGTHDRCHTGIFIGSTTYLVSTLSPPAFCFRSSIHRCDYLPQHVSGSNTGNHTGHYDTRHTIYGNRTGFVIRTLAGRCILTANCWMD